MELVKKFVRQDTMQTVHSAFTFDKEATKMSMLPQEMISASFIEGQAFRLIGDTFRLTLESPSSEKQRC